MTTTTENLRRPTKPDGWRAAAEASAHAENERQHPPRRFSEMLPVRLTEAEIGERARRAALARRRVAEYESQQKAAADHWKLKIKTAEAERDELLDAIDSGVEDRAVECVEIFEWRTGLVRVTRADTGETIRERAMTAAERQPNLPHTAPPSAPHVDDTPRAHDGDEPAPDAEALAAADDVEGALVVTDDDGIADAFLHATDDLDELESALDEVVTTYDDGIEITDPASIIGDEPPAKSKRGRKSKKA